MIIPLSNKVRIHGTDTWFAHALGAACEREIRTHPANTLADAIEAADAIAARYGQLLDCALDEIAKREVPNIGLAS